MNKIIALLTDFGTRDGYVAAMKGVIYDLSPGVNIIDITHEIKPQNIDEAAFVLWNVYKYFPKDTVYVSIVDPGVGSKRKIICVKTRDHYFLAPDNGLLKFILAVEKPLQTISVTNRKYFRKNVSSTFHGRDIFAPVAANLVNGVKIDLLGEKVNPSTQKEEFVNYESVDSKNTKGKVIHIDRFGNIISNIIMKNYNQFKNINSIIINRKNIKTFVETYQKGKSDKPFVLIGSNNLLEISLKEDSAAKFLKVKVEDKIKLRLK